MTRECRSAPLPLHSSGTHSPRVWTSPRRGCGRVLGLTSIATTPSRNSGGTSRAIRATSERNSSILIQVSGPLTPDTLPSTPQLFRQVRHQPIRRNAILLQRIAIPHRHRAILRRLPVDGDAEGRACLVLAAVAAADRT